MCLKRIDKLILFSLSLAFYPSRHNILHFFTHFRELSAIFMHRFPLLSLSLHRQTCQNPVSAETMRGREAQTNQQRRRLFSMTKN